MTLSESDEVILIERANLINNPDASPDVTFLVGANASEVTAHKVFLVSASEVFKAMFNKNFATDADIKVTDLEVEAFTQIIHYCYTLKATITEENMLGILFGAEKYMLPGLMEQGVAYVLERVNETNCLIIFNATHLLDCPTVIAKCLTHFQQYPWKFFKHDAFLKLSLSALKKLAAHPIMNCTGPDMKAAVLEWFVAHGHCESVKDIGDDKLWSEGFSAHNFGVKQFHTLTREGSHVMDLRDFKSITTQMNFTSQRYLSGVGLCAGIQGSQDELFKLTISQGRLLLFSIERSVIQTPNFTIVDVMFEKAVAVSGQVSIKVEFNTKKLRAVITESDCFTLKEYNDHNYGYRERHRREGTIGTKMWPEDPIFPFTCLAYLIFNPSLSQKISKPNSHLRAMMYREDDPIY